MISLVICTYNRDKYLPKVLQSILNQTCNHLEYEIVLVNNNCTDTTEQICISFQDKHPHIDFNYIIETQQGLSYARNRGYKESKYELIAYLDDDAFISKNYVEKILKIFKIDPNIDALGGKIHLDFEVEEPAWCNKYINSILGFYDKGDSPLTYNKSDYPRGSNMIFKKNLLEDINGFNVNLGRTGKNMNGGEEKDIFQRIYAHKSKVIYSPDVIVFHTVPPLRIEESFIRKQSIGIGYAERIRTLHSGLFAYIKRWFSEIYKWGGTLALFVIYLLKGQPAKSRMIFKFRYWISKGLCSKNLK